MSRRQFAPPRRLGDGPPDDTGCTILHVDLDAFYASASLLSHPELVGTPVIVGGGSRGVVLSATYEARAKGVTSAMPMSRALNLCPEATILRPDHHLYREISEAVMAIFADVTPQVEPLSSDEAFLDIAGATRLLGPPTHIAESIRARVEREQGITCSVGAAGTKFVAKIASSLIKPDGLLVVPVAESVDFVQALPVAALWGVGDKTEQRLAAHGLRTVADLASTPRHRLMDLLGPAAGAHLHDLAWARDRRRVEPTRQERSTGAEQTFGRDVRDPEAIKRTLLTLAERTASRLRRGGWLARTISIKVRFADFRTVTRSQSLARPTDVTHEVYAAAVSLYDAMGLGRTPLRLVGVRAEGLTSADVTPVQGLLDEPEHGWRDADRAVDRAAARFGKGAVRPASLIEGTQEGERSSTRD